jgi:hypothetical protein
MRLIARTRAPRIGPPLASETVPVTSTAPAPSVMSRPVSAIPGASSRSASPSCSYVPGAKPFAIASIEYVAATRFAKRYPPRASAVTHTASRVSCSESAGDQKSAHAIAPAIGTPFGSRIVPASEPFASVRGSGRAERAADPDGDELTGSVFGDVFPPRRYANVPTAKSTITSASATRLICSASAHRDRAA